MKKISFILIMISFIMMIIITTCNILFVKSISNTRDYCYEYYKNDAEIEYYTARKKLISCVDEYIKSVAPSSLMNGVAFLDVSEKYNIDIKFMLAQAEKEGHFATKGIAAKTHSAFNVNAYDGMTVEKILKKGHGFKHPDLSIEPYAKLLKKNYLVNGKTEFDMMDNYVNKSGNRYASDINYEDSLRTIYVNISKNTQIDELYSNYYKYKVICCK